MAKPGLDGVHRRLAPLVLARDGYRCHWCGGRATEADHLLARADGGIPVLSNYVAACKPCNAARGGRIGRRHQLRPTRHGWFA
jgi:5-methylcytosine-specific restriction endonuclease McrA